MELAEIVMNPARQRIFQYFLLHETGTVKEIRKVLTDEEFSEYLSEINQVTVLLEGILNPAKENAMQKR